ncbi:MAG: hypothetical protein LBD02_03185 [Christensenellaceae bacterium]|jgi:hypothetical protein|nr:hypothetical protein [Christensenellaceae bacterium]
MKTLSLGDFRRLRRLVYRGATPLLFARWRCAFENGAPEDVLEVLAAYQNEDGGFGHALEANCWNPGSSPYVTSFAIELLDGLPRAFLGQNHPVVQGILNYLGSGAYATEAGWLGMADIPGNNDYSHAPWFHYDPARAPGETDPGRIVRFVLRYGEKSGGLYRKAQAIAEGLPKKRPEQDFSAHNPARATYRLGEPLPTDLADSPGSPLYPRYKALVEAELDGVVDRLRATRALPVPGIDGNEDWSESDSL